MFSVGIVKAVRMRKAFRQYFVLWSTSRQDVLSSNPLLVAYGRPIIYPLLLAVGGLVGLYGLFAWHSTRFLGVAMLAPAYGLLCHRRVFQIDFESLKVTSDIGVWPFNKVVVRPVSEWKSVTLLRARRDRSSWLGTSGIAVRYVVSINPNSVGVPEVEVPQLMFDESEISSSKALDMAHAFADRLGLPLSDKTKQDVQPFVFLF